MVLISCFQGIRLGSGPVRTDKRTVIYMYFIYYLFIYLFIYLLRWVERNIRVEVLEMMNGFQ